MSRRGYRLLPHTADLMVEVRGSDEASACAGCVEALFSLVTDRRGIRAREERSFRVSGGTPDETLFLLLREAFGLFAVDGFLVRRARVTMGASGASVSVRGEPADFSRHAIRREIKAVPAHALSVRRTPGGFVARFVVDV